MRVLLATGLSLCAALVPPALAAAPARTISTSGVRLGVPAGWHALVSTTPRCDPERLVVASSAPVRVSATGRLSAPGRGDVLVLLLEDRQARDRPVGDLRRPGHFSVAWARLRRLDGSGCGFPDAPMFMRYFESHGRYLGFIVYPGARVGAATRAQTLALMDSLHVGRR